MSKTLDMLNMVERQRKNKYSTANTLTSKTHTTWMVGMVLLILFLSNLGFNFRLFLTIKSYNSERNEAIAKLTKLEALLNDNAHQLKRINAELQNISLTGNTQAVAIENLVKAKDTLFKELSQVRAELEEAKRITSKNGGS